MTRKSKTMDANEAVAKRCQSPQRSHGDPLHHAFLFDGSIAGRTFGVPVRIGVQLEITLLTLRKQSVDQENISDNPV